MDDNAKDEIEYYKAEVEKWKSLVAHGDIMLGAAMAFANAAVRGLLILNGGAAIALLALVGHVASGPPQGLGSINLLAPAIWFFGVGAGLSVLVAMGAYVAQLLFNKADVDKANKIKRKFEHIRWTGELFRSLCVLCAILAICAFFLGISRAIAGFDMLAAPVDALTQSGRKL